MNTNRLVGLDILRSFAIFFVLSVHFFGFVPFHGTPMVGENMALQLFMRQLFFLCIPLFLLLTGYFQSNKELSKSYFSGLKNILLIYLIYSMLSILFKIFYQKEPIDASTAILSILNYTSNPRGWYVNMYIGLFLIIPFLNTLYNNLKNQNEKIILIVIMCFLTSIPGFVNQFPFIAGIPNMILPDWWMGIYPLTYYFIGAYIKEYKPKIKKFYNIIAFILVLLFQSSIYFLECRGGVLEYTFKVQYNGNLLSMVAAVLFFILLYDVDIKNKVARFLVTDIAVLSFDIYLASFISDYLLYPYFIKNYFKTQQQFLKYYLIIVPLSLLMSYLIAFIRRYLNDIITTKRLKLTSNAINISE
ncbi:MAG: acyltransferase family protein [Sedimentibacter saalensis]|uniref:acyltransferase n=1 Tax=Sedimentibacter saalensis TaxID=130788 RepID=UPI002B209E21|nr:acyltransferase family protein [Sedimentibacter saalensis]MEA5093479.1 acyltransferase family protein [Sedimentibacter saalensis]